MTRPIKFRARAVNRDQWVYGLYFTTPLTTENFNLEDHNWFDSGRGRHCIVQENAVFEIDEETLGQFTGLKDKNGKDIYEGDILKRPRDRYYYVVRWGTTGFGLSVCREDGTFASSWKYVSEKEAGEVIGNIYDSPELLTNGDE